MPSFSAFQHTLASAFVTPNAVGDRPPSHNHPSSVFPTRFIMVIIIQCRRSASAFPFIVILPFLPRAKVQISPHPGLLFYLVSFELILLPYKIAHTSSRIPSWGFGGHCTHYGGKSLLPDPPHPSSCDHTPTFLSVHFFSQIRAPPSHGLPLSCQLFSAWKLFVHLLVARMRTPPTLYPTVLPSGSSSWRFLGVRLLG